MPRTNQFKLVPDYYCNFVRVNSTHEETLTKRQRCRDCGKHIMPGERAVLFEFNFSEYHSHWRFIAYIHPHECAHRCSDCGKRIPEDQVKCHLCEIGAEVNAIDRFHYRREKVAIAQLNAAQTTVSESHDL